MADIDIKSEYTIFTKETLDMLIEEKNNEYSKVTITYNSEEYSNFKKSEKEDVVILIDKEDKELKVNFDELSIENVKIENQSITLEEIHKSKEEILEKLGTELDEKIDNFFHYSDTLNEKEKRDDILKMYSPNTL